MIFVEFQTIILRFRDLVTEAGETIIAHDNIIKEKQAVWWAWWNKGNERIPVQEFSTLRTFAENDAIAVYLLDSGQKKLYKATCSGVNFSTRDLAESPSPELTPEYYRSRKYPAWFKFIRLKNVCQTKCASFLMCR